MGEPLYYTRIEAGAKDVTNQVTVRDIHQLEADEPSWSDRGNDSAPCPVDYLLVAVGGCQVETIRYCLERSRVKRYEVEALVQAKYDDAVTEGSGIPNPMTNSVATIHTALEVSTPLEFERQVHRCLELSEKHGCIVSRSIEPAIDVRFETSVRVRTGDEESSTS